jgi:hypothetical protein
MKHDDLKMFTPPLAIDFQIFSSQLCQSFYDVKQKAHLELSAPLAISFLIANYCMGWRCNYQGLSQDEGLADFSKNLRASLFNKYLANDPTFGQIYLAGQYL